MLGVGKYHSSHTPTWRTLLARCRVNLQARIYLVVPSCHVDRTFDKGSVQHKSGDDTYRTRHALSDRSPTLTEEDRRNKKVLSWGE